MATTKTTTTEDMMMQLLQSMQENNAHMNEQQFEVLKATKTVRLLNLLPFEISFATARNPKGYILEGNQINNLVTVAEVEELINSHNVYLVGVGDGNNAMIKILDDDIRHKLLGEDEKYYLTEDEMKRILDIKNASEFEAELKKCVKFRGQIRAFSNYACEKFGEENLLMWQRSAIDRLLHSL